MGTEWTKGRSSRISQDQKCRLSKAYGRCLSQAVSVDWVIPDEECEVVFSSRGTQVQSNLDFNNSYILVRAEAFGIGDGSVLIQCPFWRLYISGARKHWPEPVSVSLFEVHNQLQKITEWFVVSVSSNEIISPTVDNS